MTGYYQLRVVILTTAYNSNGTGNYCNFGEFRVTPLLLRTLLTSPHIPWLLVGIVRIITCCVADCDVSAFWVLTLRLHKSLYRLSKVTMKSLRQVWKNCYFLARNFFIRWNSVLQVYKYWLRCADWFLKKWVA